MKITGDVPKFAAEQGIDEVSAIERGLHEKAKGFQQRGAEVYEGLKVVIGSMCQNE